MLWMLKHEAYQAYFSGFYKMIPDAASLSASLLSSSSLFSLYPQQGARFGWCQGASSINQVTCFFFFWIHGRYHCPSKNIVPRLTEMGSCPTQATSPCFWTKFLCSWAPTRLLGPLVILSLNPLGKCKNHWFLKSRLYSMLASSQAKKCKWGGFEQAPFYISHLRVKNWSWYYLFAKDLGDEWGELSRREKCE